MRLILLFSRQYNTYFVEPTLYFIAHAISTIIAIVTTKNRPQRAYDAKFPLGLHKLFLHHLQRQRTLDFAPCWHGSDMLLDYYIDPLVRLLER